MITATVKQETPTYALANEEPAGELRDHHGVYRHVLHGGLVVREGLRDVSGRGMGNDDEDCYIFILKIKIFVFNSETLFQFQNR